VDRDWHRTSYDLPDEAEGMRAIAVDPGISNTGWAVFGLSGRLVRVGLIKTEAATKPLYRSNSSRAVAITRGIAAVVHDGTCSQAYVEAPGGSKSLRAAVAMSIAFTAVVAPLELEGIPCELLQARKVKELVCADKSASKMLARAAVLERYPEAEELIEKAVGKAKGNQEHVYDAIAIGMAGMK
jgi:Holliday junction resolvasome RuvABC endonuclease subunit